MQFSQNQFDDKAARPFVDIDGDTTTVVAHGGRTICIEQNVDARSVARQRFVDGIVHNFTD